MHIGISSMNNLHLMRPDTMARALEERGFESLWIGEHSHIPVNSGSPYPDGKLPEPYKYMADSFVSLAVAAAVTKKLVLGTGVTLLLERDVFNLAKEIATLDQLSGGRLILGFGVGWNQQELENVSKVPWKRRYTGMKDCVGALKALWTQDEAAYEGEFYRFGKVWSFPKPLQMPHPPIHLGVAGRTGIAHAAEWADGWMPIDLGVKDYAPRLEIFRQQLRDHGRDPAKVPVSISTMTLDADKFKRYRDLGIDRAMINISLLGGDSEASILKVLDSLAKVIPQVA